MEKSNSYTDRDAVIRFLAHLPAWWVGVKAIEAAFLRSKNPEWWCLYSTKKLLFLLICAVICLLWGKCVKRIVSRPEVLTKYLDTLATNPNAVFITFALLTTLSYQTTGITIGEDIAGQVKSSLQFISNDAILPNFVSKPNWDDLCKDQSSWSLRPPGASWLPLPGLLIGLSLGDSIRLALFTFQVSGGLGWLLLAKKFKISKYAIFLLAVAIGLSAGICTTTFGTTNCFLYAFVPWMIIWALGLSKRKETTVRTRFFQMSEPFLFYLVLGMSCIIKLSGMIVAISIASIPLISMMACKLPTKAKIHSTGLIIISLCLLLVPFKVLEHINTNETGLTADEMYQSMDYNQQSLLWGEHFTESTKGMLLVWSLAGGPGYALPAKQISHGFRDLLLQFKNVRNWLNRNSLNPHVLFVGGFGLMLTWLMVLNLVRIKRDLSHDQKIIYLVFFLLPFLGLAAISYLHGFNYVLYSAHTIEYSQILAFPILLALGMTKVNGNRLVTFLVGISIGLPIVIHTEKLVQIPFTSSSYSPSQTGKERGFEAIEYSKAISAIEQDSRNASDILLFLPEGNAGDLILRTKLRTMTIHFAGDNLPKRKPCRTSQPTTVYCAYSPSLRDNKSFQNALKNTFPQATEIYELTQPNANDVVAIRVTLEPKSKEKA